jgi:hypothetical protein
MSDRGEEFPEFSKKENSNSLLLQHNFEFVGAPLISLRSLALALTLFPPLAGQVGTGCCPNPFSRFLCDESGKGRSSLLRNLFPRILKLGSTTNPKLSARGGIRQLDLWPLRLAKNC